MRAAGISRTWSAGVTVFGALVWVLTLALSATGAYRLELMEQLFLLAPLLVVPIGLELAAGAVETGWQRRLLWAARRMQPVAAALVVAAFYMPAGDVAAWLCAPWMLVTALSGAAGAPFVKRLFTDPRMAGFEAGLTYLPVGGVWLLITRLGLTPMGLEEPIILLTAVHFHFSGFAAAVYTACLGRALTGAGIGRQTVFHAANIGVIGGTFLVATGFLVGPEVKFAAISLYGASLLTVGVLVATVVSDMDSRLVRGLLFVSYGALGFGALLAVVYGLGEVQGELIITVPRMAEIHGTINALGFVVCGLLGWRWAARIESEPRLL
jgi:hypothetical protein